MNGFLSRLRVAASAAFVLASCHLALEVVAVGLRTRAFVLSPQEFFGAQMYDFCLKLFLEFPGSREWLENGSLDRFLPAGFAQKLPLAQALVLPNLAALAVLVLACAVAWSLLGKLPRPQRALWTFVAIGLAVHLIGWATSAYIPRTWSPRSIVRNYGRVFFWEGTYVALVVWVLSFAGARVLLSLGSFLRWGISTSLFVLALVAPLASPGSEKNPDPVPLAGRPADPHGALAKNVVLISIDSLRADRLGCYGNANPTSPTMDMLARDGVRFANCMSTTSWTAPAHMSMLTGLDVLAHGVITDHDVLPEGIPTLAGVLAAAGFATGGIVSAPFVSSRFGFARGFAHYDDETIPAPTSFDALKDEPAPQVTELALKWLAQNDSRRFFLFLHYWDVHYDYIPPPPYDRMFDPTYEGTVTGKNFFHDKSINKRMPKRDLEHLLALYDGEIRWVDDHLARLVSYLKERGIFDETAIFVTADHGDEFFEHGFKGHGRTLYREVTHIPLIVRAPGVRGGRVVDDPVSLVDLAPTILDLLGVDHPPGFNGTSLLPALSGRALPPRPGVQAWLCSLKRRTNCIAMLHDRHETLIHAFQPLRIELYSANDLLQKRNLAQRLGPRREAKLRDLALALEARWRQYRDAGGRRETGQLDEATREQLRALGYID
ncbi:MAG: hypothetical protein KatS3mg076_2267 [Candidatus Binatia bacterium]|nr:MAG: hypothetical protein KatS3mg076_2267 [Candidatus Binatia bacterium]